MCTSAYTQEPGLLAALSSVVWLNRVPSDVPGPELQGDSEAQEANRPQMSLGSAELIKADERAGRFCSRRKEHSKPHARPALPTAALPRLASPSSMLSAAPPTRFLLLVSRLPGNLLSRASEAMLCRLVGALLMQPTPQDIYTDINVLQSTLGYLFNPSESLRVRCEASSALSCSELTNPLRQMVGIQQQQRARHVCDVIVIVTVVGFLKADHAESCQGAVMQGDRSLA
ncbi:hypothetical protein JZ751_028119 [Albula glossodonta]|uniref:Uncharacterized protein n=1 Tax=Albula glossodonta TaxID=121402 RepID=A0A8T2PEQ2_9TELE|nr:hypothetical protein JZ751_028119 [Albula glossodonta]